MSAKRQAEKPESGGATYDAVGVRALGKRSGEGLGELARWVNETFGFNAAKPMLPLGYFANVIKLSAEVGIAISTDGVGTKILIAQELGKYDTIGIDCIAMNVNDVICVGARPVSMVDYIAVQKADPEFLGEIGKGLYEGARQSEINIPGGEIAQVREMIHGTRDDRGFDLVGTCIGTVHPDRLIIGEDVRPGDLVVGIASSGIHSNGLTLARKALFKDGEIRASSYFPELGKTIGEELLTPTRIYVKEVMQMLGEGLRVKALIHITSEGPMNLVRARADAGYVIDKPLEPPPIYSIIKKTGGIDDATMFEVFNMGTGFCIVIDPRDAERARQIAIDHGGTSSIVGYAVSDRERRVWLPSHKLAGIGSKFSATSETPPPYPKGK
ncbi:MAG TPA: phosphoribosylformylglycinamidine cyclo-ligase [Candidatus Binataceae bacterium]|nr:phosphoribosylformylglycinamidine cyclo-ligase [Candidatus Binataceae bacterium]